MSRCSSSSRRGVAAAVLAASGLAACQNVQNMTITSARFGEAHGDRVRLYTLTNDNGVVARITNYGAAVTELHVPDRDGNLADVVLGFETVDDYIDRSPYFGAMCGRVGNRIAGGRFTLDGETYQLAANNGPHHLHGGLAGFDKVVWKAESELTGSGPALKLTYRSPGGEEGYPGTLDVTVVYTLTQTNELRVVVTATTDRATPVNIVHHSYWNLGGHDSGDVLGHELMLAARRYTPADETLIPTGAIEPVAGTPFDFTTPKTIGRDIAALPGDPGTPGDPGGYDLNYVIDGEPPLARLAARVREPVSGRVMEIRTTEPGIQLYSGNFLDGIVGKGGAVYDIHAGFCLETQHFPDSINKEGTSGWPSIVLRPGETYRHVMVHRFLTD